MFSDKLNYQPESRTGVWDRIVCGACEKRFNVWDDYGIDFVRRHKSAETGRLLERNGDAFALVLDDVNYDLLKLFVLSMLWRADANTQAFFHRIDLGAEWRDRLTDLILHNDPGQPDELAVVASPFRTDAEKQFMADPHRERYNHINHVRFYVYGGFTFLIKVDRRKSPEPFSNVLLRPSAPFVIFLRNLSPSEKRVVDRILEGVAPDSAAIEVPPRATCFPV